MSAHRMTVEDIKTRVEEIRKHASDPERAHVMEDDLRDDVLDAIADGAEAPASLAAAARTTVDIEFPRWYS